MLDVVFPGRMKTAARILLIALLLVDCDAVVLDIDNWSRAVALGTVVTGVAMNAKVALEVGALPVQVEVGDGVVDEVTRANGVVVVAGVENLKLKSEAGVGKARDERAEVVTGGRVKVSAGEEVVDEAAHDGEEIPLVKVVQAVTDVLAEEASGGKVEIPGMLVEELVTSLRWSLPALPV